MHPLPELPRLWPSIELPGYRDDPDGTYYFFAYDELPPIERELDDELRWLLQESPVPESLAEVDQDASTPATAHHLDRIAGPEVVLPRSFVTFVSSNEPRTRVRSCTDCYLDLADFAVPVAGGGSLIHVLSDSQWVLHWLLYVDDEGSEAIVVTGDPLGFELHDEETVRLFDPAGKTAGVCSESFSEFLYRFWIENEIWMSLADPDNEPRPLTPEQQRHADHYTRPRGS